MSDVEAALERLRNAWDRYANGYDIGIKHPSEAIEAHIASQQAEIERLRGWFWQDYGDGLVKCRACKAVHPDSPHARNDSDTEHRWPCPMGAALAGEEAKP